ncbi:MAG: hypothetical protein RLZZ01_482, partial [Actinomycetota bacterium]
ESDDGVDEHLGSDGVVVRMSLLEEQVTASGPAHDVGSGHDGGDAGCGLGIAVTVEHRIADGRMHLEADLGRPIFTELTEWDARPGEHRRRDLAAGLGSALCGQGAERQADDDDRRRQAVEARHASTDHLVESDRSGMCDAVVDRLERHTAEQIRDVHLESAGPESISERAHPVGQTERMMEDDDGSGVFVHGSNGSRAERSGGPGSPWATALPSRG